jgi:hypothetical protein
MTAGSPAGLEPVAREVEVGARTFVQAKDLGVERTESAQFVRCDAEREVVDAEQLQGGWVASIDRVIIRIDPCLHIRVYVGGPVS